MQIPRFTSAISKLLLAMRRDDVAAIVEPAARRLAEQLVAKHTNRIDVPKNLSLLVPTAIVTDISASLARRNRSRRLGDVDVLVPLHRSLRRPGDREQGAQCRGLLSFCH